MDNDNLRLMFISAMRYAMGRRTYITSVAEEWFDEYSYLLNKSDITVMLDTIKFNKDNDMLGDKVDIDNWNNINLEGNRTFYYYNNIEISDTTFFKKVDNDKIETMCDLGFGIERLRWCVNNASYYDNGCICTNTRCLRWNRIWIY